MQSEEGEEDEGEEQEVFLDSRDTGDTAARCVETAGNGRYGIVPVFQGVAAGDYVAFHWPAKDGGGWSVGEVNGKVIGKGRVKRRWCAKMLQISHHVYYHGEEAWATHALQQANYGQGPRTSTPDYH
jgi:hypothetical protein